MIRYPKVFNSSGELLGVLNTIIEESSTLYQKLNADYTFMFEIPKGELKTEFIVANNRIEVDDQLFEIKYIETTHSDTGKIVYRVECEHVIYRLLDEQLNNYARNGTPTQILQDMIQNNPEFTIGQIDFDQEIVFAVNETATRLRVIQLLAAAVGGEISYTNKGFTINITNTIGSNTGFQVRINKNINSIRKIIDIRGQNRTYYEINLNELKQTDFYQANGFDNLEQLNLGDVITVKDAQIGVDIQQQILAKSSNPIKEIRTIVELVNEIELASDEMFNQQIRAVGKDEYIYGIRINNQIGFEVERNDQLARTVMNADEFRMQKGDGSGVYTDALFFDPINRRYNFVGAITVESITGLDADDIDETADRVYASPNWRTPGQTTINGGAIATDSILASSINVNQLSAISANLGLITAGQITGGSISISSSMEIGNQLTLGALGGSNVQLARTADGFFFRRNSQNQMKFFTNGTVVNDQLFMVNGQYISVLSSFDSTSGFTRIFGLSTSRINLGDPQGGATIETHINRGLLNMNNNSIRDVDEIRANDFIPRSKTTISDPPTLTLSGFPGSTYGNTEQTLMNQMRTGLSNIDNTVRNLIAALRGYGLI